MPQALSVITLGIADLARSKRFYGEGFGWAPVFENDEIVFYQLNGIVFGTWLADKLAADMQRPAAGVPASTLAHNVGSEEEVTALIDRLAAAGGTILRAADAPAHGGFRGYVADPDGHAWEIAWNRVSRWTKRATSPSVSDLRTSVPIGSGNSCVKRLDRARREFERP
ncbi:VOC family protein [Sphingomonas sp. BIUV-7]|uniref:VOC family protein n=1 Tax=Sphingomonas natans TaxID=3063330 RepID=A0ABT8Y8W6_9SPHN|nr:VOC family protein [Sphingomonas sp. BIUV-7]MDO6414770.1 VOC family protein [Sphingomonas sp. BIUV-7]